MEARKISEVIQILQEIEKQWGDLNCVYSIDEEGNAFEKVYYHPTVGKLDDRDFSNLNSFKDRNEFDNATGETVVCIN
jgi:hypothetical protein